MAHTVVLAIGHDPLLLQARSTRLQAAGYTVESFLSLKQALAQFRAGDFDLVIVCYSIPPEEREHLSSGIRAHSALTPIIQILEEPANAGLDRTGPDNVDTHKADLHVNDPRAPWADGTVHDDPVRLLNALREALVLAAKKAGADTILGQAPFGKAGLTPTILCIDDEPDVLMVRRMVLQKEGYRVLIAGGGAEGLELFSCQRVDAVILDYVMAEMPGGVVAAQMRQIKSDVPIILHSGSVNIPKEQLSLFTRFVSKGESPMKLLSVIKELLGSATSQKERAVRPSKDRRGPVDGSKAS
jgi:CheY-like chemotaxis protein